MTTEIAIKATLKVVPDCFSNIVARRRNDSFFFTSNYPALVTKNVHFLMLRHEGQLDHPVSTFSFAPKEVVQMFSPEMHPGPTILGPPPVGRHRT